MESYFIERDLLIRQWNELEVKNMGVYYERIEKEQGININIHSVNEFKLHLHDEIELLMVLKGSIDVITSIEKTHLKENEFIIINKNQLHSTRKVCHDNICLAIQFNSTIIDSIYPSFSEKTFDIKGFYEKDNNGDLLDKEDLLNKVRYHIASIVWESNKMKDGHEFEVGIHLLEIAKLLTNHFTCESISKDERLPKSGFNGDLHKIINYIESSIEYGVTLNEAAKHIEMSPSHFSRFFKNNIGITFQEYKNIRRLDKAEELLLHSNQTITDIALSC